MARHLVFQLLNKSKIQQRKNEGKRSLLPDGITLKANVGREFLHIQASGADEKSAKTTFHAWKMPGKRYDIGSLDAYYRIRQTHEQYLS
ncbi:MAG: hypothetical protein AB7D05_02220 [Mangrovibacterium sp.]